VSVLIPPASPCASLIVRGAPVHGSSLSPSSHRRSKHRLRRERNPAVPHLRLRCCRSGRSALQRLTILLAVLDHCERATQ